MLRSALSRRHSSHWGETQVTWRHQQGQEVALSAAIPRSHRNLGGKLWISCSQGMEVPANLI